MIRSYLSDLITTWTQKFKQLPAEAYVSPEAAVAAAAEKVDAVGLLVRAGVPYVTTRKIAAAEVTTGSSGRRLGLMVTEVAGMAVFTAVELA